MKKNLFFLIIVFTTNLFAQKDSLQIGDSYADDQLYALISYNQMHQQPKSIGNSQFSYGLSFGFMKDIILNKAGSVSIALGAGYGYDFYNHKLKIDQIEKTTSFSLDNTLQSNTLILHNLEIPFQIRWRTSTANKYKFWRIYTGIKLLYNLSNTSKYVQQDNFSYTATNSTAFNKLQYGLTLAAGYADFNIHAFYGLTPLYHNANLGATPIETKALKIGLIFYFL